MGTFLFQVAVQGLVVAVIWVLVARDATKLRERHGTTPAGISPFAWGALCGLTWVALIPYLMRRNSADGDAPPAQERNLLAWFGVLTLGAALWAGTDAARGDANNAGQHVLLAGCFVVCAAIAWSRDRTGSARPVQPGRPLSTPDEGP